MALTSQILLSTFLTISLVATVQSSLYGAQIRKYFQDLYAPKFAERSVSRRNIPTIPGSGVFQESSSRDLDVGFGIGVKDEGDANDVLIHNHSTNNYSPPSPEVAETYSQETIPASKVVNIGVYVDPRTGMRYFTPGLLPTNPKPNVYESPTYTNPAVLPAVTPVYPSVAPAPPIPSFPLATNLQPFTPYPVPYTPRYPEYVPSFNPPQFPPANSRYPETFQDLTAPTFPYQFSPTPSNNLAQFPGVSYSNPPYDPSYSSNLWNRFPSINRLPPSAPSFQNYYQQQHSLEPSTYSPQPFFTKRIQISPEPIYRPEYTAYVFDDGLYKGNSYPGRFPRSHSRFPYRGYDSKYGNFQKVFNIQEQFPRGSPNQVTEPVVLREEAQSPEVYYDEQGLPMMTSQPYGERQIGAFKLKNDHGYQVAMNVPPIPADGPTDGVLVMEMKANLYRPIS